jgi:hypothetical protein
MPSADYAVLRTAFCVLRTEYSVLRTGYPAPVRARRPPHFTGFKSILRKNTSAPSDWKRIFPLV